MPVTYFIDELFKDHGIISPIQVANRNLMIPNDYGVALASAKGNSARIAALVMSKCPDDGNGEFEIGISVQELIAALEASEGTIGKYYKSKRKYVATMLYKRTISDDAASETTEKLFHPPSLGALNDLKDNWNKICNVLDTKSAAFGADANATRYYFWGLLIERALYTVDVVPEAIGILSAICKMPATWPSVNEIAYQMGSLRTRSNSGIKRGRGYRSIKRRRKYRRRRYR